MSLKITITEDLEFGAIDSEVWADRTMNDAPMIIQRHKCSADATWWKLVIDREGGRVCCYAQSGMPKSKGAKVDPSVFNADLLGRHVVHRLLLRPGTFVLSELEGKNLYEATVRFRSPNLQEFMDRYRLYAMRRCSLNGRRLPNMMRAEGITKVYTIYVRTDGELEYDAEKNTYEFRDCTWVLEERVRYDAQGNLLEDGYILYTRIRSLEQLERIFLENRVFQEYSWVPSFKKKS